MNNYITKPKSINRSQIVNKSFSFHSSEYRIMKTKNDNYKKIKHLVCSEGVGEQIDVGDYLSFKSNYKLVTISNMNNLIIDTNRGENISPDTFSKSSKKLFKGDILISRNASLGKITIVIKNFNGILNGGISFLRFKENKKFYVMAFFIIEYGKDFLTLLTSGGGTQKNAKRENLLNVKIPFPTISNHQEPKKIETLISLIVQNIIDKEEQIKSKNEIIDNLIETELRENRNQKKFIHSYPKVSEIKEKSFRLDTSLYTTNYKSNVEHIENYKFGFNKLNSLNIKWVSGSTPSALIETNKKNDSLWIAVADISYGLTYRRLKSFRFLEKINVLKDADILITRKGATVGKMIIYFDTLYKEAFVNEDLKVLRLDEKTCNNVFIGLFLNSKYGQVQMLSNGSRGTKQGLTNENILNVKYPNFPDDKQKEISKEYYNKVDKSQNLSLKNYTLLEKQRNKELGIYQLNMEIFELKEKLNGLVDKVIMNEKIDIVCDY